MSPLPRRATGGVLAAVLLAAVPLAAACEAGQEANVKKERFGAGSFFTLGKLRLNNVQVQPPAGQDRITGDAALTFSIYNQGETPVRLTQITSDSGGRVQAGVPSGFPSASASASASPSPSSLSPSASSGSGGSTAGLPATIPSGGGLTVGPTSQTQLMLTGLGQTLSVGRILYLTFRFDPGGSTGRLPVPVTSDEGTTATVEPRASVSGSPSALRNDEIDPSYYQIPYDDRRQSQPAASPSG